MRGCRGFTRSEPSPEAMTQTLTQRETIPPIARLRRRLFGLSPDQVTFRVRGFHEGEAAVRVRLERVGEVFLHGYHAALEETDADALALHLGSVENELSGFAFEGAAMSLALLDLLALQKRRWRRFAYGPGSAHIYMVHVGYGWALARLRRRVERPPSWLDPLLGWLVIDGYGFHEGYFYPQRYVVERTVPTRLSGYARRVFDQGLGRSLWFVEGADVIRIPQVIGAFPPSRQADLWSGVGLACAYAGGVDRLSIQALRDAAGRHRLQMAQGAAFAAKARQRAGNPAWHTELACEVLCGTPAEQAARWTDAAQEGLRPDGPRPMYEVWRLRIREIAAREVQST